MRIVKYYFPNQQITNEVEEESADRWQLLCRAGTARPLVEPAVEHGSRDHDNRLIEQHALYSLYEAPSVDLL